MILPILTNHCRILVRPARQVWNSDVSAAMFSLNINSTATFYA
jgi:hypothetical protein